MTPGPGFASPAVARPLAKARVWTSPKTVTNLRAKISRNAPCGCGSGKKFKSCCLPK